MRATKDCAYPVCEACQHPDCIMSGTDIRALLKRRQRQADPESYRQKQRDYRSKIKSNAAALRWLRILRTGPQGETGRIPEAVHCRDAPDRTEGSKQSAVVQEERKAEWDER